MTENIIHLDHINRYVSSVDAITSFYTDALGFKLLDRGLKKDGQRYAILQGGGLEMFVSEKDDFEFDSASNLRHIGFSIEDAGQLLRDLKAGGYVPKTTSLIDKAWSRQFFMKDPDGFELDFIEWTDKNKFYQHLSDINTTS